MNAKRLKVFAVNKYPLLENIASPADLKRLEKESLEELAAQIRSKIIETVSRTGGHLAPSLGVVDLSIALHYVFQTPPDKIIFDVGHQAYAHKLLTGRFSRFDTLRQRGGLSGFARMSESPYDAFTVGHASTSISAGLGMACGKELKGERAKVISVIGDGSMTAGLAYEGLNQAGGLKKDLIVVLNDNEMSIAPNVGALSAFLSRKLSSSRSFIGWREEFKSFLRKDSVAYKLMKRLEESFKAFITPGMLFEAFEFNYFGPINGHRIDQLIDAFEAVKETNSPALVHVLTTKGKGYEPAEKNPTYFHGVGCFEIATGNCVSKAASPPSYTQVFGKTLIELAQKDEKIVAVTAAMPEGTGLAPFALHFPDRFFDVGIAEQHGVTFAAGLAVEGFVPVVAIYSTFMQRAYDQVLHDVCIESLPVVFAMDRAGIVGEDGPTHHGAFDLSFLRSIPNLVLMAPADENELARMLKTAVESKRPIGLRYPRGAAVGVEIDKDLKPVALGKAKVLKKGNDVLVLAVGPLVYQALEAARRLEKKGIGVTVVNARFIKPIDSELILDLCSKIPRVLTIEENSLMGGFGSAVLECLADAGLPNVRVSRMGICDRFVEHGTQKELRRMLGLDEDGIVGRIESLLESCDKQQVALSPL
ncbi:MAG: 1-deoxy-D-xylulose-5-phosphate synthase [Desulfatibacillaceae bacterium]|nr:1-deoxy-D-xylulose-5-phosphate synthase [Desulfatibacillaceae bacterium]